MSNLHTVCSLFSPYQWWEDYCGE